MTGKCRGRLDRIAPAGESRPSTTPSLQILNTPSMIISPVSKRAKGSIGTGAPGLAATLPVPGRTISTPDLAAVFCLECCRTLPLPSHDMLWKKP
jgi:hypothetical protein